MSEEKPIVSKEEIFDRVEIRIEKIISIEAASDAPKAAYVIKADFGKFGTRTSVGRFTQHSPEELKNKLILGVLNFEPRMIGSVKSEFLCLGVQYPKSDSGEAPIIHLWLMPRSAASCFNIL